MYRRSRRNGRYPSSKTRVQNASRQTVRTLNRITNFSLNADNPNGGTRGYATVLNPLSAFAGADSLTNQYEQFRITRVSVYARPDTTNQNGIPAAGRVPALQTAQNNVTVSTYVDYDSFSTPAEADFLGRDGMKIRSLPGGAFRLIASYSPKCRLSDATNNLPALVPNAPWINTAYADLDWLGLAIRSTQDSPFWGTASTNALKVQLFIKATVRFRGLKKPTGTVALQPALIQYERPSEEDAASQQLSKLSV